jgi:SAM-dependent methyltransferase
MTMARNAKSVNYWPDNACAKAFWSQHELPPYQELLAATKAWLDPKPLEKWLDLGCGGGQLTRALWQASVGRLAEIVGVDCAAANAQVYDKLRTSLQPPARDGRVRFLAMDFSRGLPSWQDNYFDGVVSGLAIHYAESYSDATGRWTCDGYDALLREVHRVLRPGGRFVFSVNVPEPSWARVAWTALRGVFSTRRPLRLLKKGWRIWRYGGWLKRESRRGRFHYLPLETVVGKLRAAGFESIRHKISFAKQAYLLRCCKGVPAELAGDAELQFTQGGAEADMMHRRAG